MMKHVRFSSTKLDFESLHSITSPSLIHHVSLVRDLGETSFLGFAHGFDLNVSTCQHLFMFSTPISTMNLLYVRSIIFDIVLFIEKDLIPLPLWCFHFLFFSSSCSLNSVQDCGEWNWFSNESWCAVIPKTLCSSQETLTSHLMRKLFNCSLPWRSMECILVCHCSSGRERKNKRKKEIER